MAQDKEAFTVGVVIPTYNYADGVRRAIESVLAQRQPADEIVVVNDGSTDHTLKVISGYGNRLQWVSQPNRGAAAARNHGVRELGTDWVAFLDQDDTWLPEKLERQCAVLNRVPGAAFCTTGAFTYFDGKPTGVSIPDPARIARNFRYRNCFGFVSSSCMIRRDAFMALGGFRESQRTYADDWELAVRLYLHYPFLVVPEPLINYFESSTGAGSKAFEMMNAELSMADTTLLEGLSGVERFLVRRRLLALIRRRAARNLPNSPRQRVRLLAESFLDWPLPLDAPGRLPALASALLAGLTGPSPAPRGLNT